MNVQNGKVGLSGRSRGRIGIEPESSTIILTRTVNLIMPWHFLFFHSEVPRNRTVITNVSTTRIFSFGPPIKIPVTLPAAPAGEHGGVLGGV